MGQAIADLPDPLEMTPPPPSTAAATDDLLSQIAGDEIDRLMAESEGDRSVQSPVTFSIPEPSAPSIGDQIASVLNDLEAVTAVKSQSSDVATEQIPPVASNEIASRDPQGVMSTAERDALGLSNLAVETDAAEHEDAIELERSSRPGIVIRLLEMLNSPLSFVPDGARDAIGKLAIVTLANSIAVLVYVMLFRR